MSTVIEVENLGKKYTIRHQQRERYTALRDVMARGFKNIGGKLFSPFTGRHSSPTDSREDFWALKDVAFEIKQGERVGIIGRNGAGKTTVLKLLSRITEPTTGRIEITGRVASLLEVGTGFHPELTGSENIFLNGAILGMSKGEIKKKFDEIVAFAEIEKFLDTPVKRYSSGMYVRLAFAVAAHLEPEILIVDEVLAVGDAQFQKKCLGKMEEVGKEGRTILFVSHNMSAIQTLCSRCIVLQGGRLIQDQTPHNAVKTYLNAFSAGSLYQRAKQLDGNPSILSARLKPAAESVNSEMHVLLEIHSAAPRNISIDLRLTDGTDTPIGFGSLGTFHASRMCKLEKGLQTISFVFPTGQLAVGSYFISLDLTVPDHEYLDRLNNCLSFEVVRTPVGDARRVLMQSWGYGSIEIVLKRTTQF